jgi:hypothetical protein
MPADQPQGLALPNQLLFAGSGAPVIGTQQWSQTPKGLIVPAEVAAPSPLSSVQVYLTPELLGASVTAAEAMAEFDSFDPLDVAMLAGSLLARYEKEGANRKALDLEFAESWFHPSVRGRARALLQDDHYRLFAPQALLVMLKVSLANPGQNLAPDPGERQAAMLRALLSVAQYLGTGRSAGAGPWGALDPGLALELVSNYYFNASLSTASTIAHHQRMWVQIAGELAQEDPEAWIDFPAEFEISTGFSLADFHAAAVAVWAGVVNHGPIVTASTFASTALDHTLATRVLDHLSTSCVGWLAALSSDATRDGHAGTQWDFGAFERFPLLRLPLDGGEEQRYLVLSPRLFLRRLFGGLAYFDVLDGLERRQVTKGSGRLTRLRGEVVERYVLEVVATLRGGLGAPLRCLTEDEMQTRLDAPGQVCDAVLTVHGTVVLIDAASRKLARPAVTGRSLADLDKEIDTLLVAKARQLDATRELLLERWTDAFPGLPQPRRFLPVVVVDDDWPLTPPTCERMRERLRQERLLQSADTGQLEVMDLDSLDAISALESSGMASLVELLDAKSRASLRDMPMMNFLVHELHLNVRRPTRIENLWHEVMADAIVRLGFEASAA